MRSYCIEETVIGQNIAELLHLMKDRQK